uniref:oleoyl-[acyl-carrier-protein] hydrolase n=1 Tax=Stegastes partitus TaxID=144197 RepID=A0A3B4ZRG3_9TELE
MCESTPEQKLKTFHYPQWNQSWAGRLLREEEDLPGRESRAREPFFEDMQQIVEEVVDVLLPLLQEKPFALFGHRTEDFSGLFLGFQLKNRV